MNPEPAQRSLLMFATHAWDEAERRFERAADAELVAIIAWAHMREARRRVLDKKPLAKIHRLRDAARDAA